MTKRSIPLTKICTKCGKELPATSKHFYHDSKKRDGFTNACRDCTKALSKEYGLSTGRDTNRKPRQYHIAALRQRPINTGFAGRKLPKDFENTDWQNCLDYWETRCAICGKAPDFWHTLAADHWIPISSSDCPGTIPRNILPLCHGEGGCNNKKGRREPEGWVVEVLGPRRGKRKLAEIQTYFDSVRTTKRKRKGKN